MLRAIFMRELVAFQIRPVSQIVEYFFLLTNDKEAAKRDNHFSLANLFCFYVSNIVIFV